jgi:hypothetical protein
MEDHRWSTSQAEHSERHVLLKKKVKNCTKAIYKPTQPLQTRLHYSFCNPIFQAVRLSFFVVKDLAVSLLPNVPGCYDYCLHEGHCYFFHGPTCHTTLVLVQNAMFMLKNNISPYQKCLTSATCFVLFKRVELTKAASCLTLNNNTFSWFNID